MTTRNLTLTQAHFDEFARLSGDDNPIHVDPEFSARTRFGRTVAHGMFLFAILQAEVARSVGGPVRLTSQDLVFSAPTFAGDPLQVQVTHNEDDTFRQVLHDSAGTLTAEGLARLDDLPLPTPAASVPSPAYKGLEVGMSVSRTRSFTAEDVTAYLDLVADPNPLYRGSQPELPPPLLGGMVSWLLGVDLPGRGTNWLKQRFHFLEPVTVPATVTTTVTITRLRPDKGLVNLANTCAVSDKIVVRGDSLVLAVDVVKR